jgi:hypothetical protein
LNIGVSQGKFRQKGACFGSGGAGGLSTACCAESDVYDLYFSFVIG